jgi:hypothetical protein
MKKQAFTLIRHAADVLMLPITILCSIWINLVIKRSLVTMPLTEFIFLHFGFLPVRDHYYQPLINPRRHLKLPLETERVLPGIDLTVSYQLDLLAKFNYADELSSFPLTQGRP